MLKLQATMPDSDTYIQTRTSDPARQDVSVFTTLAHLLYSQTAHTKQLQSIIIILHLSQYNYYISENEFIDRFATPRAITALHIFKRTHTVIGVTRPQAWTPTAVDIIIVRVSTYPYR